MNRHRRHREQLKHPSLRAIHGDNDAAFVPVARAMVVKWIAAVSLCLVSSCGEPPDFRFSLQLYVSPRFEVVELAPNGITIAGGSTADLVRQGPSAELIDPVVLQLNANGVEKAKTELTPYMCGMNCGVGCTEADVIEEFVSYGIPDNPNLSNPWLFSHAECKLRNGRTFSFVQ